MKWLAPLLALIVWSPVGFSQEVLRWGADIEAGAPFSFKDPADPKKIIGFEAEIVEAIAKKLGMTVQFHQNNWEGLIQGLNRGDYDIVVNGLEITPDRREVVNFSRPYYITAERLTVASTNEEIKTLEDCEGKKVATLAASLAQRILAEQSFPMQVITYADEVNMYADLLTGRVDAVLMDEPIALYYAEPNERLKNVGELVGYMEYGIATRKNDPLSAKIDEAVAELIRDGTIRRILERWGLWNSMTAKAWGMSEAPESEAVEYQRFVKTAFAEVSFKERIERYISFLPLLGKGAMMTLHISIVSMFLAMVVGLVVALSRLYGPWPIRWLAISFIEIFRGTPLLIQLFLIFYGLPHIGIRLDPFLSAVVGLGLNYGACEAENYRAGILSIPQSQVDASRALGLNRRQTLRHIVLPQAMRLVIPPVTNDFIALLKDSSLVSIITMVELTNTYGQLASTYFDYLGLGLLTALIYFLIGLPFVRLSRQLEAGLSKPRPTGFRSRA